MNYNDNITKLVNMYRIDPTIDFNYELTRQKMRKFTDIEYLYNSGDNTFIEYKLLTNTVNVGKSIIANNSNIDNIRINDSLYNSNTITINNNLLTNNIQAYNATSSTLINVSNNSYMTICNINNNLVTANDIMIYNILTSNNIFINSSIFNNSVTANSVFSTNIVLNNMTVLNQITISSLAIINNNAVCTSNVIAYNMFVNNFTNLSILNSNTILNLNTSTINSSLVVSSSSILNNTIMNKNCYINTLYKNTQTCKSNNVAITNLINCPLEEYYNNTTASINGIKYGQLYRTGGIVKIRTILDTLTIILKGYPIMYVYLNNYYNDPLFEIVDAVNISYNTTILGNINYTILGDYNISYRITDNYNNNSNTLVRIIKVIDYPSISNISFVNKILTFNMGNGYNNSYNSISYIIYKNNVVIQEKYNLPNIESVTKNIDISNIVLDNSSYTISILINNQMNEVIKTFNIFLNSSSIDIILEISGSEPYKVNISTSFNIFNNVVAYTLPRTIVILNNNNFAIKDNLNNIITTSGSIIFSYNKTYIVTFSINSTRTHTYTYNINVYETIKPVITLLGNSNITLIKGKQYIDAGYNIVDSSSGKLDSITGYVNINIIGIYFIKYTARDFFNNTQSVIRQINIISGPPYITGLKFIIYVGYFEKYTTLNRTLTIKDLNPNPNSGIITSIGNIALGTNNVVPINNTWSNYSVMWYGYFKPTISGTWTFNIYSNGNCYLWIGDNALTNYSKSNTLIINGPTSGRSTTSGTISLEADIYYDIRILLSESDNMTVKFYAPNSNTAITDGTNYFFSSYAI